MSRSPLFLLTCTACGSPAPEVPPEHDPAARVASVDCAGSPFGTIQGAIDAAVQNEVIEVCPGTHFEHLVIDGKRLTLRSQNGAADTVVDAGGTGRTLTVSANSIVTVDGLTFTNGYSTSWGGNIWCDGSNLLIRDSVVEGGVGYKGGGLGMRSCTGRIEGNTFRENVSTYRGGGIYVEGTVDVLGNTFEANEAVDAGGAAYLPNSWANIRDNLVVANFAEDDGGGIFVMRGAPWVDNNLFADNTSGEEGGGLRVKASEAVVTDNVFTNNHADWRGGGAKISHEESIISGNSWTGNEAGSKGGALLLFESASTLTYEHYEDNEADEGGAVAVIEGWGGPTFEDCTFEDNEADLGGHLYVELEIHSVALRRVDFVRGVADEEGGAVYASAGSVLDFRNVLFASNTAGEGGGAVSLDETTGVIHNAVAWGNSAPEGAAVRVTNGVSFEVSNTVFEGNSGGAAVHNVLTLGPLGQLLGTPPTFRYNDFYGNTWGFLGMWSPIGGNGNVSVPTGFVDPAGGDCSLLSTSPLRDAGDPALSDPDGSRSDIGLFGGPYAQ